jgi:hypothetical protein
MKHGFEVTESHDSCRKTENRVAVRGFAAAPSVALNVANTFLGFTYTLYRDIYETEFNTL